MTIEELNAANLLGDRVIVKPIKYKETKGGIIKPLSEQDNTNEGEVVKAGEGILKMSSDGKIHILPTTVKKGQKVWFGKYGWQTIEIEGEEDDYYIMRESDLYLNL